MQKCRFTHDMAQCQKGHDHIDHEGQRATDSQLLNQFKQLVIGYQFCNVLNLFCIIRGGIGL